MQEAKVDRNSMEGVFDEAPVGAQMDFISQGDRTERVSKL